MSFTKVQFDAVAPGGEKLNAIIERYKWTVHNDDPDFPLLPLLNTLLDPEGPSAGAAQPDHEMAVWAVEVFGGKIISEELVDRDLAHYPPGAIFQAESGPKQESLHRTLSSS